MIEHKEWNYQSIIAQFSLEIAQAILQTEIIEGEDKPNWSLERRDLYTFASGYKVAHQFYHPPLEVLSAQCKSKKLWSSLWNLKCPQKIRIFYGGYFIMAFQLQEKSLKGYLISPQFV
ncbi:hypothetical protein AHAS_Ahas07G0119900 [Arachis hypogaea]